MQIRMLLALAVAASICGLGVSRASADVAPLTNAKHFFWAPGQNPAGTVADSTANDLVYHGGNAGAGAIGVETKPAVYLIYWGQEWADGFQTADTDGTDTPVAVVQDGTTRIQRTLRTTLASAAADMRARDRATRGDRDRPGGGAGRRAGVGVATCARAGPAYAGPAPASVMTVGGEG